MTTRDATSTSLAPAPLNEGLVPPGNKLGRRPWRRMSPALVCAVLAALDLSAVVASSLLAFGFHFERLRETSNVAVYCLLTLAAAAVMVTFGVLSGLYEKIAPEAPYLKLGRALLAWTCTLLVVLGGVFFLQAGYLVSRGWVGYWFVFGAVGLFAARSYLRNRIAYWRSQGVMRERVVVVGASATVRRLVSFLQRPELSDAYEVLGVFDGEDAAGPLHVTPGIGRRLGPTAAVLDFVRRHQVEVVIVSTGCYAASATVELCDQLSKTPIKVHLCPDQDDPRLPVIGVDLLGGVSLLQVNRPALSELARITKGVEDRVLAALMLAVAVPSGVGAVAGGIVGRVRHGGRITIGELMAWVAVAAFVLGVVTAQVR